MVAVLTSDVIRQHIDRIDTGTLADLFALSELNLSGPLGGDLGNWAARAGREVLDLPDTGARVEFLERVARLPADSVPARMRAAIRELKPTVGTTAILAALETAWEATPPTPVVLPAAKARAQTKAPVAAGAPKAPSAPRSTAPRTPRTPASMVDPRRAEWVREDVTVRLSAPEYRERGLKESILVEGIRRRSPYKDLTSQEILAEMRKLERERKLKHTAERWMVR